MLGWEENEAKKTTAYMAVDKRQIAQIAYVRNTTANIISDD